MREVEHALEQRLLDFREAARVLGVSPASIRRWSRSGRLRTIKLGKSSRFDRRDLENLIKRGGLDASGQSRPRAASGTVR